MDWRACDSIGLVLHFPNHTLLMGGFSETETFSLHIDQWQHRVKFLDCQINLAKNCPGEKS